MKRDYYSDSFFQSTPTDQNSSKVLRNIMVPNWIIWPSELNQKTEPGAPIWSFGFFVSVILFLWVWYFEFSDTFMSFCYFWVLDMAPTYAVPGLFLDIVPRFEKRTWSQFWKKSRSRSASRGGKGCALLFLNSAISKNWRDHKALWVFWQWATFCICLISLLDVLS